MSNSTGSINYATDYQLDSLVLVTSLTDGIVNLMPYLVELNLFEDIYSSSISGQLVISDGLGILSKYFISGTEFIEMSVRKSSQENSAYKKTFRIFKISNRTTNPNNMYEVYTINFCSEEFLLSEQYRISKSYRGTKISDIVYSIMKNYVQVGTSASAKNLDIENTSGVYDFILPNKKLFETINWLSTYAQSQNNNGADMVFFENADGYFFYSLQTMFKSDPYQTYFYDPKNITQNLNQQVVNVKEFEILDFFDTLGGISNGTFSNQLITLDPLLRKSNTIHFNYDDYYNNSTHLNKASVINNYVNRNGDTLYDKPSNGLTSGALRMATSNSEQKKNSFISQSSKIDSVGNDIFIEKFMSNRVAQVALANYTRIKIAVPGDSYITAGKTVIFNSYGVAPTSYTPSGGDSERRLDPFYSGKYLVTAVRHIIKNNSFVSIVELAKDSSTSGYAAYNNSNLDGFVKGTQ